MAYSGFLFKVGNYVIPQNWIAQGTYSARLHGQDLDSYQDGNGDLHRTALDNAIPKVEFNTPALRTAEQFESFMANIRENYTNATEKRFIGTVYIAEIGGYVTQDMYLADVETSYYSGADGVLRLDPVRMAFIGYGKGAKQ